MDYFDWSDFTPREFFEYCKKKFAENIMPKIRAFADGLYNISTWLEESICPTSRAVDATPTSAADSESNNGVRH